jgi:flagellin-specific chaperone FliS
MPVIDEYVQASVNTAGPWKLHLMVVDRALSHARSVVKLLELRMFEDAHLEAGRSREFIVEIISAMRSDAAPGLVASVKEYFLHVQKELHLADLRQDSVAAGRAVELLDSYRETWLQLRDATVASA